MSVYLTNKEFFQRHPCESLRLILHCPMCTSVVALPKSMLDKNVLGLDSSFVYCGLVFSICYLHIYDYI